MSRSFSENWIKIGERIRKLREAKGRSMSIADDIRAEYAVKLDASYLSRMELGKAQIPLRTIFALADYFKINPALLIDPDILGDMAGVDFLAQDETLLKNLIRLKEGLGDEKTRNHLLRFTSQLLEVMEDSSAVQKTRLRASRRQDDNTSLSVKQVSVKNSGTKERKEQKEQKESRRTTPSPKQNSQKKSARTSKKKNNTRSDNNGPDKGPGS